MDDLVVVCQGGGVAVDLPPEGDGEPGHLAGGLARGVHDDPAVNRGRHQYQNQILIPNWRNALNVTSNLKLSDQVWTGNMCTSSSSSFSISSISFSLSTTVSNAVQYSAVRPGERGLQLLRLHVVPYSRLQQSVATKYSGQVKHFGLKLSNGQP